jgi:starch-binding outer membrane protein, SusD/RagB family
MKSGRIISLVIIAITFGCGDKLNIEPFNQVDGSNAIQTSADVQALLVGAYDAMGDGDVLGGNMQRDSELLGDDGEVFWDGTFVAPGEIWVKSMLVTNDQAEETWLDAYRAINICNLVLANVDLVTAANRDIVEGEAKFIRGTLYFELVKLYAKTWTDGNPAQNPGVPLRLTPTTPSTAAEFVERSSVSAVYAQIISDLEDARDLLPSSNGFFASTYSASGVLSRVYLMQNEYALALAEANEVIETGEFALTGSFANAFGRTSSSGANATSEDVFALQVTSQDGVNNLNTFFASADFAGRGDILIEQAHFDLYETGDERADFFYDDTWTAKFNNQFGNITIVRLAEMYLTRAECNFELGTSVGDSPLNDINTIRTRAGLPDLGSVDLTDILLERRLELAFEGHLLHDLKRRQLSVGSMPFNDNKLVFPIPQRERIINPSLTQNPGYGN